MGGWVRGAAPRIAWLLLLCFQGPPTLVGLPLANADKMQNLRSKVWARISNKSSCPLVYLFDLDGAEHRNSEELDVGQALQPICFDGAYASQCLGRAFSGQVFRSTANARTLGSHSVTMTTLFLTSTIPASRTRLLCRRWELGRDNKSALWAGN